MNHQFSEMSCEAKVNSSQRRRALSARVGGELAADSPGAAPYPQNATLWLFRVRANSGRGQFSFKVEILLLMLSPLSHIQIAGLDCRVQGFGYSIRSKFVERVQGSVLSAVGLRVVNEILGR